MPTYFQIIENSIVSMGCICTLKYSLPLNPTPGNNGAGALPFSVQCIYPGGRKFVSHLFLLSVCSWPG